MAVLRNYKSSFLKLESKRKGDNMCNIAFNEITPHFTYSSAQNHLCIGS